MKVNVAVKYLECYFQEKFILNSLYAKLPLYEKWLNSDGNKQIILQEAVTSIYNISQRHWVEMKPQPLDWYIYTPQYNEYSSMNDTRNYSPYDYLNRSDKPTCHIFHFDRRLFPSDKPISRESKIDR